MTAKRILLVASIVVGLGLIGVFFYRRNSIAALSEPDKKEDNYNDLMLRLMDIAQKAATKENRQPGIQRVSDGIITTNMYTKQERFHPYLALGDAEKIAKELAAINTEKNAAKDLEKKDELLKKRKELIIRLQNSFYRYNESDSSISKMSDSEINGILVYEATFNGIFT